MVLTIHGRGRSGIFNRNEYRTVIQTPLLPPVQASVENPRQKNTAELRWGCILRRNLMKDSGQNDELGKNV